MKNINISSYGNGDHWIKYHVAGEDWLRIPEIAAVEISKVVPSYIENIIIFGCSSGRDFIPFQGKDYNFYGFDICSEQIINWICDTSKLEYYCCSIEDFLIHHGKSFDIDLSKSLVYSSGTLMYASSEKQNELIYYLINNGCKNMCFQEYSPDNPCQQGTLYLDENNKKLFSTKEYRNDIGGIQPTTYYMIDNG